MLTNVKYNEDEYEFPCLLVLGCFDAIHRGHAELLKKAKLQAKINGLDLGVMVFSNGKGGSQICTFEEKLGLLERYNVKFVLSVDFTDEFKKTKPLDFLQNIEDKLNVKAYMSGKDFRFGAGAKGKSSTLKNYGEDEENGVWYMPVKDVVAESGEKISTTQIKELIESGDIKAANELLGRNYSLSAVMSAGENGEVSLAYPESKVKVKSGVYSVKCLVAGVEYDGVANCGDTLNLQIKDLGGLPEGEKITVEFTGCCGCAGEVIAERPVEELAAADETPTEENVETETVGELAMVEEVPRTVGEPADGEKSTELVEEVPGNGSETVEIEELTELQTEDIPATAEETVEEITEERFEQPEAAVEPPVEETFADDDGFYEDYIGETGITEEQPVNCAEESAVEQPLDEPAEAETNVSVETDEQTTKEPETAESEADYTNETTDNGEHID